MSASGSSFDMDRMSGAGKILMGGSLLLLLDSLLAWQKGCCASFGMWSGSASWAGLFTGLLAITLLIWEGLQLAGQHNDVGRPASRISSYLGFGVLVVGIVKVLLVMTNEPAFGAFLGIILILAIGYGAWMRFQEPAGIVRTAPTGPPPSGVR